MVATSTAPTSSFPTAPITRASAANSLPPRREVNLIVIHCSATPSGKPLRQGTPGQPGYLNAAKVIDAMHAQRGFKRDALAVKAFNSSLPHIGYHYVIDLNGEVINGRGRDEIGAHAVNFNAHSVGICMVGGPVDGGPKGGDSARYTAAQWKSLRETVEMLRREYSIVRAIPRRIVGRGTYPAGYTFVDGICGHRDLSPDGNGNGMIEPFEWLKTCPGFDVGDWIARDMQPLPVQVCEVMA